MLCTCHFVFMFKLNEIRKIQRKEPDYYEWFPIALNDEDQISSNFHFKQKKNLPDKIARFVDFLVYNYHSFHSSIKIEVGAFLINENSNKKNPNRMRQLHIAPSPITNSTTYNVWMTCSYSHFRIALGDVMRSQF